MTTAVSNQTGQQDLGAGGQKGRYASVSAIPVIACDCWRKYEARLFGSQEHFAKCQAGNCTSILERNTVGLDLGVHGFQVNSRLAIWAPACPGDLGTQAAIS